MARRSTSGLLLLFLLLLTLLSHPPARAEEGAVTIGLLPLATRSAEIMLRGSAPVGSTVAVSVNGEVVARVHAAASVAIYRVLVPLQPGRNLITAQLEETEQQAVTIIHRITASLTDIEEDPLREDIEILATMGIVSGDPSGRFLPGEPLTRAQLAKMIVLALGLPPAAPAAALPVTDAAAVQPWARPYVAAAYARGLLRGYQDGSFRPDGLLSRAELVAIAVRAVPAGAEAVRVEAIEFTDQEAIPDWVRPSVERAVAFGLIDSFWGESFRAGDPVTRGEAAAVIRRLSDLVAR